MIVVTILSIFQIYIERYFSKGSGDRRSGSAIAPRVATEEAAV
jgi:hypothetical protein